MKRVSDGSGETKQRSRLKSTVKLRNGPIGDPGKVARTVFLRADRRPVVHRPDYSLRSVLDAFLAQNRFNGLSDMDFPAPKIATDFND